MATVAVVPEVALLDITVVAGPDVLAVLVEFASRGNAIKQLVADQTGVEVCGATLGEA